MTSKFYRGSRKNKSPKMGKEPEGNEYGKSGKGVFVCKKCHNIRFKKEWHHPISNSIENKFKGQKISFVLCPACTMVSNNLYEGEVVIKNVPSKYEAELMHLIAGYNSRAQQRDPQDRIVEIKKLGSGYRITTTENQLAVKLAKKIKGAFKKQVELGVSYSKEPQEVSRVSISFI